jgi:ferredoxin
VQAALVLVGLSLQAWSEQRFPPPDFESGYKLPITRTPLPRSLLLEYLDVVVLMAALGLASYLVLKRRSRRGVFALSLFSLGYFGFYRKGCICAIGSVQNVALSFVSSGYVLPLTALAFFLAPLVVSLFAGRSFCAAVCPHGALQDLVLLKPLNVPNWLEEGLGLIPYLFLGAGVAVAAAGGTFLICRYDPFVPLFRRSGNLPMLVFGGGLLALGLFVGRPYCRFLCPYGALLKLGAKVSKWRVTITPDVCTQCRLCEPACPYGAIRYPTEGSAMRQATVSLAGLGGLAAERRRLGWLLLLVPAFLAAGAVLGWNLGVPASKLSPTVALAERYLTEQKNPVPLGVQTAAALSLMRADQDPPGLLKSAIQIRQRFQWAGLAFGVWAGLVIGCKLIGLSIRAQRSGYEPDRGACVACARCFAYCPSERVRCGLVAEDGAAMEGQTSRAEAALVRKTGAAVGEGAR